MTYTLKVKWQEKIEQEYSSLDEAVAAAQHILAEHPDEAGAYIWGDGKHIYASVAPHAQ